MTLKELAKHGRALFGERWQSDMARALGITVRYMQMIAAGERALTDELAARVTALVGVNECSQRLAELDTIAQAAGVQVSVTLSGADGFQAEAAKRIADALRLRGYEVRVTRARKG